jgi:hypothetical protein
MKTMFSRSVFDQGFFSGSPMRRVVAPSGFLGRAHLSSMMPLWDRTRVGGALAGITGTLVKLPELDAAVSDMGKFNATMGPDGAEFLKLSDEASAICLKVKALYDRLLFQDPGEWYADGAEIQAMVDWTARIERMYFLYAAHFPKLPPSTALPPGSPTCPTPSSAVPTTPGTTSTPGTSTPGGSGSSGSSAPGSPPPSAILGVDTKTVLIGGGVAAALGILVLVVA